MPAIRPSRVKNMIRNSLLEIIDPSPTKQEVNRIWEFFDSKCAYCGESLNPAKHEGHIDHLDPSSVNGRNHISNRVLSCPNCNQAEKRDAWWGEFIRTKNQDETKLNQRIAKIHEWQKINAKSVKSTEVLKEIEKINALLCLQYDNAVKNVRSLKISNEK